MPIIGITTIVIFDNDIVTPSGIKGFGIDFTVGNSINIAGITIFFGAHRLKVHAVMRTTPGTLVVRITPGNVVLAFNG